MNTYKLLNRIDEMTICIPRIVGFPSGEYYQWSGKVGEWEKLQCSIEQKEKPNKGEMAWMIKTFDTRFMDSFDVAKLATIAQVTEISYGKIVIRYWGQCFILSRNNKTQPFQIQQTLDDNIHISIEDIDKYLLSDREALFFKVGLKTSGYSPPNLTTEKLNAIVRLPEVNIIKCGKDSNNYGEWLFVSFRYKNYICHYYGAGYSYPKDRHIYNDWRGFSGNNGLYEGLSPLDKSEVLETIRKADMK